MEDHKTCKIYKLTNLVNNKIYIGQTWLPLHKRMGKNGSGYRNSKILYNAIKKYGVENFKYTVLYEAISQEESDEIEDYFIKLFDSQNLEIGYNIQNGGSNGKHTPETIEKISEALRNRERTDEHRERLSIACKGINAHPRSEEFKQKVSETMKEWHRNNDHPLLGVPRTEEQKQAQRDKLKGKPQPKEAVEKRNALLRERFKMTEDEELEIIRLYQEEMLSYKAICDKLHINNRKIKRVFEKHNIKPRKKNEMLNKVRWEDHTNAINEQDIINMYLDNEYSINDIKDKYNTSYNKIYEIIEKSNISKRNG